MKRKEELQKEEILAPTDFLKKVSHLCRYYVPFFSSRPLLSKERAFIIAMKFFPNVRFKIKSQLI